MGRDYIDVKIDTDRHLNGEAVAKRLRGERREDVCVHCVRVCVCVCVCACDRERQTKREIERERERR